MANNLAIDIVGDTSLATDIVGDTSLAVDLIETPGPSAVTAREQPRSRIADSTFSAGAQRGFEQTQGLFGQVLKSVGDRTGLASLTEVGDELIQEAFVEAVSNPARIDEFDDIDSLGKFGTFVAEKLGEQVFNIGLAATGGGIGALLGRAAVAKAASHQIAKRAALANRKLDDFKALHLAMHGPVRGGSLAGGAIGAGAAFTPINTGEILQESRDAGFDPDLSASLLLGAGSSALEVAGLGLIGKAIFGPAKKEIVNMTLKNVLGRVGHTSLKSLAAEGGTEAVQEALIIASRKINDPTFSISEAISSAEGLGRIGFAGAAGAVVGGALGGAGGAVRGAVDTARIGVERARSKLSFNETKESFESVQGASEDAEVAETLVDFELGIKNLRKGVTKAAETVKEFFRTVENNELAPDKVRDVDVNASLTAASEQLERAQRELNMEEEAYHVSEGKLKEARLRVAALVTAARNRLAQVQIPETLSRRENEAVRKTGESIKTMLERVKTAENRSQLVPEMLDLAKSLVDRAIVNPAAVPISRVDALLKRINAVAQEHVKAKNTELAAARKEIDKLRKEVDALNQQLTKTEAKPAEPGTTTTPVGEVVRSIRSIIAGVKPVIFAAGHKISSLDPKIRSILAENPELRIRQLDPNRIVIGLSGDIQGTAEEIEARVFDTPLNEAEVVVTTRDKDGGVTSNEGVPRDPVSVQRATTKPAEEGATRETREADEAVIESVREVNDEAEASVEVALSVGKTEIAQLYRAITGVVTNESDESFANHVANIPDDTVVLDDGTTWGEFREMYDNSQELASRFVALQNKFADPESFAASANQQLQEDVQSLEDFIESALLNPDLFNAGIRQKEAVSNVIHLASNTKGELVRVEIALDVDGNPKIIVPSGVELKEGLTPQQLKRKLSNKTSQRLLQTAALDRQEGKAPKIIHTVETIGGVHVLQVETTGEVSEASRQEQVRRIETRGNDARFSELPEGVTKQQAIKEGIGSHFVIQARKIKPKRNKDGDVVFDEKNGFTTVWLHLGEITRLGELLRPQIGRGIGFTLLNFREGMASLIGDHGYRIDFDPQRDGDKLISGRHSYNNVALASVITLPSKKTRAKQLAKEPLNTFVGDISNEEKIKSELDDIDPNPDIINVAPGLKQQEVVSNSLTDADGKVWETGKKALDWFAKRFDIKEKMVVFDEASAESLIAGYEVRRAKAKSKAEWRLYNLYIRELRNAISAPIAGRMIPPPNTKLKELRAIHIFVRREHSKTGKYTQRRAFILAHEFGHVVQYVYLTRLNQQTRQQIFEALAGYDQKAGRGFGQEGFANWMAAYAAEQLDLDTRVKSKKDTAVKLEKKERAEIESVFKDIVKSLNIIWKRLKHVWSQEEGFNYPQKFKDFVDALNTHQKYRGDKRLPRSNVPSSLKTPLARKIFMQLQTADAGPFLPDNIIIHDPILGVETKRKPRSLDAINFDEEATTVEERAEDKMFQSFVDDAKRFGQRLKTNKLDAARMVFWTADGELRSMGDFGQKLAKFFWSRPSSTDPSGTVFRKIQQAAAPFHEQLQRILDTIPGAHIPLVDLFRREPRNEQETQDRKTIIEALQKRTPVSELRPELRIHVARVRKYLRDMHKWYTDQGLELNEVPHYYPLMLDSQLIEQRRGEFIEIMRRHGFTEAEAQNARMKITRDENGGLSTPFQEDVVPEFPFQGPGFSAKKSRAGGKWTDALRNDLIDAGFYQQDLAVTLMAYTDMAVRRAVWETTFRETDFSNSNVARYDALGLNIHSPIAKLQFMIEKAKDRREINDWQYERITKDILPAYAGQLGLRTNYKVRKLSSLMVIYQNLRLLSMAVFSSFVDVGTLMARGDWEAHKAGLRVLTDKATREQAYEALLALGAMRQGLTEHILNDQVLTTFMTGRAKRINDMFFRFNMMEGWTNLMRAMALESGTEFVRRHAQKALSGNAKSQRYLDYLGISATEIAAWDGTTGTATENIKSALNRYIDESMIRPNAAIRPVWMSDPGYSVFAHLKGFLYGFHETFLRRVGREALVHHNLLPLLTLGMLALPFAVIGYELRRKITGSKRAPEGFAYFKEVVERSGLPGAFQLALDAEQANAFSKPFVIGVAGPTVEQVYDLITRDMDTVIPKAIPLVAQSPVLRDWMRTEVL